MCKQSRALLPLIFFVLTSGLTAQTIPGPTSLGQVNVGASAAGTITFSGLSGTPTFSVTNGTDFTAGAAACAGGSCSVPVTFKPSYPGLRQGAISAVQNGTYLGSAAVYGIGTGPEISIGPGQATTIANRTNTTLTVGFQPTGVAVNPNGQVYVADKGSNRIFLINPVDGQVSVFAGNGTAGYSGDGGAATSAALNLPFGMALDGAGNLYFADTQNNVIRRVNVNTRIITTVAGNRSAGFGGDGGPATSAQLNLPVGVAVDVNGNMYISDTNNNRVRLVNTSGVITTFAGTGTGGAAGDGGPATSAQLNQPAGLALDAAGTLYIADESNGEIRQVAGGVINTVVGSLVNPAGVAVDAGGSLYISDISTGIIRKVTGDATRVLSIIGGSTSSLGYSGDGGPATQALFGLPAGITIDPAGNVIFVDATNFAVREITGTPAASVFPLTAVGSTASLTVTVSNLGNANLTLSGLTFSPNFSAGSGGSCSTSTSLLPGASCTLVMNFSPTNSGPTSGTLTIGSNSLNQSSGSAAVTLFESNGLRFVPLTPCRIADTRNANGSYGGPIIAGQATRDFNIPGSSCGVPNTALAYALNVTVVPSGQLGYLTVWPTGQSQPLVSTTNSVDGRIKGNAAIIPAGANGSISIFASNTTHLVLDINGYFVPQSITPSYSYYPVTPCRLADTRQSDGFIAGQTSRDYQIVGGRCGVPTGAQAFALNITAVPKGSLGFLTVWPTGTAQPLVSTLNASNGVTTANAAIVPGNANGQISIFASNDTDLVIDVSGYFAAPGASGLSLYNLPPCRVADTRTGSGAAPYTGTYNVNVLGSSCSVPAAAQAYDLNATVVPTGQLGFLTSWAQGQAQPFQSTLNAVDGVVSSNLTIAPTNNGSVSFFASNPTYLVVDIFGYFAR